MAKPASKAASKGSGPKRGQAVIVRSRFVKPNTVGIIIGLYEADTDDVIVQAFPVDRESIQIPAIPYYSAEPDDDVQSAVWAA
ncbi:hypothetical protein [Paraburkholderia phenoliruptrix]|uniref:hypothetical protein n=1 Tax=Paraburkholderia phenoliruptrix TaxID=252970 RepID=UPI001C6F46CB|nr:hypothetical protein [Paraburkholderia phenoliruptrix]MBW9102937.1 hypothetical protein [Paraburkholderia phenoliruptrix]MBW9132911.1 hypothetical protein [Paraburkholderia ginsengiterrae]